MAENWKDFDGNSGPLDEVTSAPTDLTPGHTGPVRYTAHHYTRGGLHDMQVAIIPDTQPANLTPSPDSYIWTEDAADDYAAGSPALAGGVSGSIQATRAFASLGSYARCRLRLRVYQMPRPLRCRPMDVEASPERRGMVDISAQDCGRRGIPPCNPLVSRRPR